MSRSLRVYQKAAIVFVVIALLLLGGVLYLSVSQATIRVVPSETTIAATIPVEVANEVTATHQIEGKVISQMFEKAKTFTLPEEGATAVEGKATGMVTLINKTGSDQPLVATTRLLSEEGVLFRLDTGVTVPANGQVDAVASADQPGVSGEIGPTQFTIPGLSPNLQEVIYAVSVDPMIGGVEYISILEQSDLDQAVTDLSTDMLEEAKPVLTKDVGKSLTDETYQTVILEQVSDTAPGTETGHFTISLKMEITGVFYRQEDVEARTQEQLLAQLQTGYELLRVNEESITTTIQSIDKDRGVATLEERVEATAIITTAVDILDVERLAGKTADEVIQMLEASDAIEDVAVHFAPFWLKRVPTLNDHVRVEVVR